MIGGDAGRAVGVALGNTGNIIKGVKDISNYSKAIKSAKLAKDANAVKLLKSS